MTETDEPGRDAVSPAKRFAYLVGGSLLGIFSIGVIAGFTKATMERGSVSWKGLVVLAIAAALAAFSIWLVRKALKSMALAKSPRMREYQLITAGTLLFGGVIGALMQVGAGSESVGAFDGPLSPAVAAVLLASLPLFAWLCYRWHQTADEHEQAAYNFGGMISLYAYFFVSFGWWIAWRGSLLPQPDGFAIFWMVLVVWSIGWAWRRFR